MSTPNRKSVARIAAFAVTASAVIGAFGTAPVATAAPARVTIQGYAWEDTNRNGKVDTKEKRLAKKSVTLLDAKGRIVRKANTNASGKYAFTNLTRGTYTVSTNLDNFIGTTLVGPKKSTNNARTVRAYKTNFKNSTWVSFGFYNQGSLPAKPAPKKTTPKVTKPVAPKNAVMDKAYTNAMRVEVDKYRAMKNLRPLGVETRLQQDAVNLAHNISNSSSVDSRFLKQCRAMGSNCKSMYLISPTKLDVNEHWDWYNLFSIARDGSWTKVSLASQKTRSGNFAYVAMFTK